MTKEEFIDAVAERSGLSREHSAEAVQAFLDSVTEALRSGESITFTGFGKFSTARAVKTKDELAWVSPFAGKASDLRREADSLERSQDAFDDRLAGSRRALRRIAESV